MWAVLLGLLLILVAATSSHAAIREHYATRSPAAIRSHQATTWHASPAHFAARP
jgi:hypothetical protein